MASMKFLLILFLFIWMIPGEAKAKKELQVGGTKYHKADIVKDFVDTSISRNLWFDETNVPTYNYINSYYAEDFLKMSGEGTLDWVKTLDPFIAETLLRQEGLPKPFVINKWSQKITVGIDWPRIELVDKDGKKLIIPKFNFAVGGEKTKYYSFFEDKIKEIIPDLKKLTGLDIEYISPDDPREISSNFAAMRIVPTFIDKENPFKDTRIFEGMAGALEQNFTTGVRIAPTGITQVDGYIIPDHNNNIIFAACKIDPRLEEALVSSLILECMVRSLGLPEISSYGGVLGKRKIDGNLEMLIPAKKQDALLKQKTKNNYTQGLLAYDQVLVQLLYCPDIKSGMSVYDVIKILGSNSVCFNGIE